MIPAMKDVQITFYQWNILSKIIFTSGIYRSLDIDQGIAHNALLYFIYL